MRCAQRRASAASRLTVHRSAGATPAPTIRPSSPAARVVGFKPMITVAALTGSIRQLIIRRRSVSAPELGGGAMRKHAYPDSVDTATGAQFAADGTTDASGLPKRLMTAFEVAEFIGCHEETVRRAYLRGLLTSQRFGVRGRRFHPADVLDWIRRGAPTRVS